MTLRAYYAPALLRHSFASLCLAAAAATGAAAEANAQDNHGRVLTLDEARSILRANNFQVQIAREQIEQTELLMNSARAVLLPNVSATGNFTFNDIAVEFDFPNPLAPVVPYLTEVRDQLNPELLDPTVFGGAGEPSTIAPRSQLTAALVATQTLYNARAFPLLRQARTSIDMATLGVEATAYQLEQAVVDTYFAAVGLQRFVEISQQNVQLSEVNVDRTVAAFEEGVGTQFDVNRAQVELSAAERNLQNAQTSYQVAVRSLALILNEEPSFDVLEPAQLTAPTEYDADNLSRFRPELQMMELQLELQQDRIREQEVLWIPRLQLQGTALLQQVTAFNPRAVRWNIALIASWDIYDSGLRRTERRRREYDYALTELQREQTEAQIVANIDIAMLELRQNLTNAETATAEVELATDNLELVREAQALGAASSLDVILAQQQLYLAELALADAEVKVQQKIYTVRLLSEGI
jgi:outer membrane protein TolC